MSLTEILLSLVIMLVVVAGVAVNYATVKDRTDEQLLVQSVEMLRANIEQIYASESYTGINNSVLTSAGVVPKGLLSGTSMKTRWGDVTVSDAEAGGYALTFQNLPPAACRTLAGLSTTSWNSVAVGETELFSRAENTAVTPSDILSACSEAGNTLVFTGP